MNRYAWLFLPFCCGILAAPPVQILAEPPASAQAPPEKIDVANSRVYVYVPKKGGGHNHGIEGKLSAGNIRLGQAAGAGEMTFDLKAFQADTDEARKYVGLEPDFDTDDRVSVTTSMLGTLVLDTAQFATAKFTIASVKPVLLAVGVAGTAYQFEGDLELHGVKKKVSFVAGAEAIEGGKTRIRGQFSLKQTDFGIKPFSKFFGAVGVADEIKVSGDIYLAP